MIGYRRYVNWFQVTWRKFGDIHPMTIGLFTFESDTRVSIEYNQRASEWNLIIQDVKPSDESIYQCQINTKKDQYNFYSVYLHVKSRSSYRWRVHWSYELVDMLKLGQITDHVVQWSSRRHKLVICNDECSVDIITSNFSQERYVVRNWGNLYLLRILCGREWRTFVFVENIMWSGVKDTCVCWECYVVSNGGYLYFLRISWRMYLEWL